LSYIPSEYASLFGDSDSTVITPAILGSVEIVANSPLNEGDTISFVMPAVNETTESVTVRFKRDGVVFGQAVVYAVPDPNFPIPDTPVYTTVTGDVGSTFRVELTPTGNGQVGVPVQSSASGVVLATTPDNEAPDLVDALTEFTGLAEEDDGIVYNSGLQAYVQRSKTTLLTGLVVPVTHELQALRYTGSNPDWDTYGAEITTLPGLEDFDGSEDGVWLSTGGATDGTRQYLDLRWRELTTNTFSPALATPKFFDAIVPTQVEVPVPLPPGGLNGTPNETLSAATQVALKAALDARISSGNTAEWIITLPNGNYGNLNLGSRQLPGRTILRAANVSGAKFSTIDMSSCKNIVFQLVDVDKTLGGGSSFSIVRMNSAQYCGFEYSRAYVGPIVVATSVPYGWAYQSTYIVEISGTGAANSKFCTVRGNLLKGPCDKHIYLNGATDCEISGNVSENGGSDFVMFGWGHRNKFIDNWGPRAYYPSWNAETGWAHNDFIQTYSLGTTSTDSVYRGNIIMMGPLGLQSNPRQGLFSSASYGSGWDYEDNIIVTNSSHGITAGPNMSSMRARRNTLLRPIDAAGNLKTTQFNLVGAIELLDNVQCGLSGSTSMGSSGVNFIMKTGDYDASLAGYVAPYLDSTLYGCRPVAGTPFHWDYPGAKKGAWNKFGRVIVNKEGIPLAGTEAYTSWKAQYDSLNEIIA
jgi:hypothetical protein